MASATDQTDSHGGALCRLCSQDSSYLAVDKDARKHVCNPHPVQLAHSGILGALYHLLIPPKGLKMSALSYTTFDPSARPPDVKGQQVQAAVLTCRTDIQKTYEIQGDISLKGYNVKGDLDDPDRTVTIYAEIDIGTQQVYIELQRYGDTVSGSSYHKKGVTVMNYLYHKPRNS